MFNEVILNYIDKYSLHAFNYFNLILYLFGVWLPDNSGIWTSMK